MADKNGVMRLQRLEPDDPWLLAAERRALELASRNYPEREGENAVDRKHEVDQGFESLAFDLAKQLDSYHAGQRDAFVDIYVRFGKAQIFEAYQFGLERATDVRFVDGGRHARDEEMRLFEKRISLDPEMQREGQLVVDTQTQRYTEVYALIGRHHDATLERLGLDRLEENKPASQSANHTPGVLPWKAHIEARLREEQAKLKERESER